MYEVDSLPGPECGGEMKIVSFIEKRPPNVVEKILLHCRLPKGPDLQVYVQPLCKPACDKAIGGNTLAAQGGEVSIVPSPVLGPAG